MELAAAGLLLKRANEASLSVFQSVCVSVWKDRRKKETSKVTVRQTDRIAKWHTPKLEEEQKIVIMRSR